MATFKCKQSAGGLPGRVTPSDGPPMHGYDEVTQR